MTKQQPVPAGVLAEFDGPESLRRGRGPGARGRIHALGRPQPVPHPRHRAGDGHPAHAAAVGCAWPAASPGAGGALLMQWWMNAIDYPLVISGKPLFSLPANIPITFELLVLLSAFGAFAAVLVSEPLAAVLALDFFRPGVPASHHRRFFHLDRSGRSEVRPRGDAETARIARSQVG